jgi:hypothetical protein
VVQHAVTLLPDDRGLVGIECPLIGGVHRHDRVVPADDHEGSIMGIHERAQLDVISHRSHLHSVDVSALPPQGT